MDPTSRYFTERIRQANGATKKTKRVKHATQTAPRNILYDTELRIGAGSSVLNLTISPSVLQ